LLGAVLSGRGDEAALRLPSTLNNGGEDEGARAVCTEMDKEQSKSVSNNRYATRLLNPHAVRVLASN
jgi:hypothetical protein